MKLTPEELEQVRADARRFVDLTLRTAEEAESEARAFAIDRARQSRPYYSAHPDVLRASGNVIRFPVERTRSRLPWVRRV